MPRIRKKTSNRTKLHDRAKTKKKVKDSKKKKVRAAKKNPQWKSKTPKDPGIPNDFPYKDQILAEVAEQRRQAAAEKEKKKGEKKLTKARAKGQLDEEISGEENEQGSEPQSEAEDVNVNITKKTGKNRLDVGAESIANLSVKLVHAQLKHRPQTDVGEDSDEDEEEVPSLVNRDLPTLRSVLDAADVVLEVLDARDPLESRSTYLENLAKKEGKKLLVVLNKIDTCPREAVSSWATLLRSQRPTVLFRSSTAFLPSVTGPVKGKGKSKPPVDDALGLESVLSCLGQWAEEKTGDGSLTVAVVGVTNVGKSSLINSLSKRAALPVYTLSSSSRGPTTTELPQEVTLDVGGKQIRLIDTPGLCFTYDPTQENPDRVRGRDILLRNKGRIDKLKDTTLPIDNITSRANNEDLMLLYSLPAFARDDPTAFLSGVARSNQLIKKKGELDLTGAARVVLRDWSTGKFARYATPPTAAKSAATPPEAKFTADDDAILAQLQPRKEMRRTVGLVRFSSGITDAREVTLEEPWAALDDNDDSGESGDEGDEEEMEVGEDGSEGEDDENDDVDADDENADESDSDDSDADIESDEADIPPPVSNKQKRKRVADTTPLSRPSKKVAFAPIVKSKHLVATPQQKKSQGKKQSILVSKTFSLALSGTKETPSKQTKPPLVSAPVKKRVPAARKVTNVAKKDVTLTPTTRNKGLEAYDFKKFF